MGAHHVPDDPYRIEIEAVDSLLPGEVAVVGTQKSLRNAPWGELLSTASKARGARGAIVDGFVRDVQKIEEIGFPVLVHPGDLVFADFDGVVVVPQAIVAEVIELASKKVRRENCSSAELVEGAYQRDVFEKYGVH